jgi:DNA-binding NarL/FixJ family response regulator
VINVVLADDHPPFRLGLRQTLEAAPGIRVVGEAGDGSELFAVLRKTLEANILLLDIEMPGFRVYEAVSRLRSEYPRLRVIIVTVYDDRRYIHRLIDLGVRGYMLKDESLSTYSRAIRAVANNGMYFSPRVASVALTEDGRNPIILSPREAEVLRLAASGLTSVAIGAQLGISAKTADTHAERACHKLGVSSRTAAVGRAVELGLISTRPEEDGEDRG